MLQQKTVTQVHLIPTVKEGAGTKDSYNLLPTTVRYVWIRFRIVVICIAVRESPGIEAPQFIKTLHHFLRNSHRVYAVFYGIIFFITQGEFIRHAEYLRVTSNQLHESLLVTDRLHYIPYKESVPESLKALTFSRKLIGCGYDTLKRKIDILPSVMEYLLVESSKKRILYGRSGLPYLIQKDDIRRRQVTVNTSFVGVAVLELADGYRSEDLIRSAEPAHQVLEAGAFLECTLEPSGHHTLSHTWQSQQKDTLPCQGAQEAQRYDLLPLVCSAAHLADKVVHLLPYHFQNSFLKGFLIYLSISCISFFTLTLNSSYLK